MKSKVLVIDDDRSVLTLLSQYLANAGYQVSQAENGLEGLRLLYQEQPDVIVLDLMMPRLDGWVTLSRIRELTDVPVLILSAKGEELDKLRGFRLGADDYVTKPFSFAELEARLQAILSRSARRPGEKRPDMLRWGDLEVNLKAHLVTRGGQALDLSPTEFRLLTYLMEHAGEVVSAEELVVRVWGQEYAGDVGYIRRYIWHLRQKIEPDPAHPQYLFNERGVGYRFGMPQSPYTF